jgi:alginate O-acetyltransferase complex protein AlgI
LLFCSRPFWLFFLTVFAVYWAIPWRRARVWLLLGASYYFYASWNQWLALVVCFSSILDYFLARGMEWTESPRVRWALVTTSIISNLSLLGYFKYADFFLSSLEHLLNSAGLRVSMPVLRTIVPIGISFYTFEAINYTVDVYRRRIKAERQLPHFMLFILFFPHLVAGPIVRARDFLPQVGRAKRWDWPRLHLGLQLIILGLFKKLAIADRMALFADPVFAHPGNYSTGALWIAVFAYSIQIYCDFSGYTDMALGLAHTFGYKLTQNFNMPYLSASIAEFWRRWHMSLSTWLRDYLYIPLGGNRCGPWRTRLNLFITMTLGGLWHGAAWHFVVWGMIHGAWLGVHREFRERFPDREARIPFPRRAVNVILTFLGVTLAWVFFRAAGTEQAFQILRYMFSVRSGEGPALAVSVFWFAVAMLAIGHLFTAEGWWRKLAPRLPPAALGWGYATVLTMTLVLAPEPGKTFIYFQF